MATRQLSSAAGREAYSVVLLLVLEVNNLESEHELPCCSHVILCANSLDGAMGRSYEGRMEAGVGGFFVEASQTTSRSGPFVT